MASSPISSWQVDGETMETVTGFIFLDSKIITDSGCSHEIKRCLLFGRKAMIHLDSILKSRDITLPTKVHLVKAMKVKVKVTQSCPTLWDPMDRSPWNSPGQNTGVGSHSLLQGIFPTQRSNAVLPHCRQILSQMSHKKSTREVKAIVFPVVKYGCESWTINKAERQRIDAFELWCWRRLLRVPWTARRSNQSILMEISPEYSLEGLMLNLKLQFIGHLMPRTDSLEKDPDAGKDRRQEEKRMTEDEMVGWHHQLNGHEFEQAPGVGDGQGNLAFCSPWGCKELDTTK